MDVQRPRGYADLGIAQEMERGEAARAVAVESVVADEIRGQELRHPPRIARFDRSLQRGDVPAQPMPGRPAPAARDRKSVRQGKSGSVRVVTGCGSLLTQKKQQQITET